MASRLKKTPSVTATVAATIIASLSLEAAVPPDPLTINSHTLRGSTKAKAFLKSLSKNAHTLPKQHVASLLAVPSLKDWLGAKKYVYVCVQDGNTTHCCTLALDGKKINCLAVKPDEELPSGAIWLMVP